MRRSRRARLWLLAAMALGASLAPAAAWADHSQPAPDISRMDYTPIGYYGPTVAGGTQPLIPNYGPPPPIGPNPSGKYVAYDTNVWESLALPSRHPGDETNNDPQGTGDPRPGFCPPNDPQFLPWGKCPNHQLEYLDYYENTMKEMLGDFGVTIKRYEFQSPGTGSRGGYLDAAGGRAINISATVPGADHPEETVLVSGHYDFTDSGPAAAWDSAEGHTEVMRIAKIMSDYWRATGTRPSATVKFIPWDSEESGTFGSIDYVQNNVPPGEEGEIRGYFNMDPCAGAYPAYRDGVPAPGNRIPEVLQLTDPENYEDQPQVKARVERFNARALTVVDDVLNHLDDNLQSIPGQPRIFVSDQEEAAGEGPSQRQEIRTAVGGLALFSSDYRNFEGIGVPIFNLFPDTFGPSADGEPGSPEGATILHTPRDNLNTLNAFTSPDQTGQSASEGWAKGMEMCAHMEGWYMLQPEMAGAQTSNPDVVAYYEALPNEAIQRQKVTFDASGSYQYSQLATRTLADDSKLSYSWDFGDGQTATGKVVQHAYPNIGRYATRLTVRNTETGATDTMDLPVTVVGSKFPGPILKPPPPEDEDGSFPLSWDFNGTRQGFQNFQVEESRNFTVPVSDDAEGDIGRLWTASDTGDPRVHPWQKSNSGTPKVRGNQRTSGSASYWTGAFPTAPAPTNRESSLTMKEPFEVPAVGDAELTYQSLFQNEGDDQGRLEFAFAEDPHEFHALDGVGGFYSPATDPATATQGFERRTVDLSSLRGRRILLQFRYILGPEDRVASQPAGWYVDDIRVSSGTFTPIGTSISKSFEVFGRAAGTYAYRVKGVYSDGVETAASNAEVVRVTRGAVPGGGPGGGGGPGAGGGPGGIGPIEDACLPRFGFRSARAVRSRRGVLFRVQRRLRRRFRAEIHQVARGRRIKRRKVAGFAGRRGSFRWSGRGRGVTDGHYVARLAMKVGGRRSDVRNLALRRRNGRFTQLPAYARRGSCGRLRTFRLSSPVFGGTSARPLGIGFRLRSNAQVGLQVRRGKRLVRNFAAAPLLGQTPYTLGLVSAGLARGNYRVIITVTQNGRTTRATLISRKL